jgi:hypothetical protein
MGFRDPAEWAALPEDVQLFWTEWYVSGGG